MYVLILRRVLNDLSLVELVAGITKTSFNTFTTSDSKSRSLLGQSPAEFHSTPKDYYRHKYFEAMDHIVQAITDRFDQEDFAVYLITSHPLKSQDCFMCNRFALSC
jgi:hypothetical protein